MASYAPSLSKTELSVEPLEPVTVPSGTFVTVEASAAATERQVEAHPEFIHVDPQMIEPEPEATTRHADAPYVQAVPASAPPPPTGSSKGSLVASGSHVAHDATFPDPQMAAPLTHELSEKMQGMAVQTSAVRVSTAVIPPVVENELILGEEEPREMVAVEKQIPPVVDNELLVTEDVAQQGEGSQQSSVHAGVATVAAVEAASKFAAGREKAVQRKIDRDKEEARRRHSELDSAFRAAAVIGKLSVAREKRIMQKMMDEQLSAEKAEYEEERRRIMEKAEREMKELDREHERLQEEIKDVGVDVLTPTERDLFEK